MRRPRRCTRLLRALMRASESGRSVARCLQPIWFAALLTLAVSLALLHPQAIDAVGSLARDAAVPWWTRALSFASVLGCALASWYFPRALLYVRYANTPADSERRLERWRRLVPRMLGTLPLALLTLACWRAAAGTYVLVTALATAAFLSFVVFRRPLFGLGERKVELHPRMPTTTYLVMWGFFGLSSLHFALFLASPVRVPQWIGPLGILFFSAAVLIAVGSVVLVYPTYRFRLPSLLLLAVGITWLFGLWNENHQVRKLPSARAGEWRRPTVREHLAAWLEHRAASIEAHAGPYPVFVVAAEGGGIRAAYSTACLLGRLARTHPDFPRHLFAISGVSGGALGAMVFSALLADRIGSLGGACELEGGAEARDYERWARHVLSRDFLSPALAGMLFPDLVQRFWPLGGRAAFPDRAAYLERAWESAWDGLAREPEYVPLLGGADFVSRLRAPFSDLWASAEARLHVPALFLNGTWVETGGRNVTSNLVANDPVFVKLDNLLALVPDPIRASTAVHMSARFTYLSPAGVIGSGEERRQVVDGGYFENSGALTAAEIVALLEDWRARSPELDIQPVVVVISASPPPTRPSRIPIMKETLAPLLALFHTREARGHHAEGYLAQRVGGRCLRFVLPRRGDETVPLGWMLSDRMRTHIEESVRDWAEWPRLDAFLPRAR